MTSNNICPFCENSPATKVVYSELYNIDNNSVLINGLLKAVCDECRSEFVPDIFYDANFELISNFEQYKEVK